ncbi:MAG: DUF72 domain-containing protein [Armatimonadota bacterium]
MPQLRIGTSGWQYIHWRGRFYPKELPQKRWLAFYLQHFDTVEINSTFYRMPKETVFDAWHQAAPEGFLFAVKGSRFVTHIRKLQDIGDAVKEFTARASRLREHLGPILWQLPPNLTFSCERLSNLLSALPAGFRYALEVRHPSWVAEEAVAMLRNAGVALCVADTPVTKPRSPGQTGEAATLYPYTEEVTSDFVYVRLHGHKALYASEYSEEELAEWAKKISCWQQNGLDVFVYFDNDANAYAVKNAVRLREMLGQAIGVCSGNRNADGKGEVSA